MPEKEKRTDAWAKVESFAKILAGFSAAVSAILIPVLINSYTEENRRAEMFVRTMTEREKADTDIRQSMFKTLMDGYLGSLKEDFVKADEDSFRRRIMFLELLTVNFQEFFNAKPLFEEVYTALARKRAAAQTEAERKKWDELERQIIRVSMNIVSRQAKMLNNIGTSAVFNIEKNEPICVRLYNREEFATLRKQDGTPFQSFLPGQCMEPGRTVNNGANLADTLIDLVDLTGNTRRQSLEIMPVSVNKAYATVQVGIYDDLFKGEILQGSLLKGSLQFDISYFDLPYMDNTKLSDGSRFALVLRDVVGDSVEIEAIRFRNDFMSLRDRPFFEEMLQKLEKEGS
ncbi:MAG: hypothetical protein MPW14_12905 [Candidatus Manganitrophus sp.]|nr:hypothetical protein [Candidatus Manganitrophus sp.]WDT70226.1 MAG: hypothetical protein MPW17_15880 [Candidatus Manganitrophus sp.]WDT78121.1 MAG: hypothetical protein MPW14_12905 [Candidatus Manganitrophus sp.]